MGLSRKISKRISDRLKKHRVLVIVSNGKGKVTQVFNSPETYQKRKETAKSVQPWKLRKKTKAPDPLGAVKGRVVSPLSREDIYK